MAEILADPDVYSRIRRLATLLPRLGPEGVPEVKRALLKARGAMGIAEFELLVRHWATHEPAEAARWALNLSAPRFRLSAISVAVALWAKADPAAAVAGVTGFAQSGDREVAQATQLALVRGWFEADREAVWEYVQGLGSVIERQRSLLGYALAMADLEGSDAVMEWAQSLPEDDPAAKGAAYRQVTVALAWTDAEASERWCEAVCDSPHGKSVRSILARLRLHNGEDPTEILAWLSRAPENKSRRDALNVTFGLWALRDRGAALAWMEQQTSGDGEPEAWVRSLYPSYARHLAVRTPKRALTFAEQIENEATREELSVRIARHWLRADEEAAEAWLAQSWLPEEARARARNQSLPSYLPRGGETGEADPSADPEGGADY